MKGQPHDPCCSRPEVQNEEALSFLLERIRGRNSRLDEQINRIRHHLEAVTGFNPPRNEVHAKGQVDNVPILEDLHASVDFFEYLNNELEELTDKISMLMQ